MAATYDVVIIGEVPLDPLWHSTPTFPPVSELWLRIQEATGSIHTPGSIRRKQEAGVLVGRALDELVVGTHA